VPCLPFRQLGASTPCVRTLEASCASVATARHKTLLLKHSVAHSDVYICDECVDVCQEIINDDVIDKPDQTSPPDTKYVCSLCSGLSPAEQITIIRHRGVAVCKSCIDAILATLSEGR